MITTNLEIGGLVATAGVDAWVRKSPEVRGSGVAVSLAKHVTGDWGDVCDEDKAANDYAAGHDERVLSAYTVDGEKIWIITEHDRSVTTILFPEEY
jgi:hypothetical protein